MKTYKIISINYKTHAFIHRVIQAKNYQLAEDMAYTECVDLSNEQILNILEISPLK